MECKQGNIAEKKQLRSLREVITSSDSSVSERVKLRLLNILDEELLANENTKHISLLQPTGFPDQFLDGYSQYTNAVKMLSDQLEFGLNSKSKKAYSGFDVDLFKESVQPDPNMWSSFPELSSRF